MSPVSAEVEAYEPVIRIYARQYGIEEYVELVRVLQQGGMVRLLCVVVRRAVRLSN